MEPVKIAALLSRLKPYPVVSSLDKKQLEEVIELLFLQLFPNTKIVDNHTVEQCFFYIYNTLSANFKRLIPEERVETTVDQFLSGLPEIQEKLYKDAESYLDNDPACTSLEEVILTYPGFFATAVYRIAHGLYSLDIPVIPRLFTEYAHTKTGVDIHPGAMIGESFFLDHGTGTVIGQTCVIGDRVKIYQGVTLGALHVHKNSACSKRHPTIEDNVIIYANAIILGGETVIGHDTVIGGNVWLTESVPPGSKVYYHARKKYKFENT